LASTRGSPEFRRALGARLRSARKAANLTLKELAARLGVRPSTLVSWESGQRQPSPEQLAALAQACGSDVGWLVSGRSREATLEAHMARLLEELAALRASLDRRVAERPPEEPCPGPADVDRWVGEAVEEALRQLPGARVPVQELRAALCAALRRRLRRPG
jgi:transcriptional regulator with XRE-family HTH domain